MCVQKCVWEQMCVWTNVFGHKYVWVQSGGLKREWAQTCDLRFLVTHLSGRISQTIKNFKNVISTYTRDDIFLSDGE